MAVKLTDAGQVDTYLCFVSERPGALDDLDLPALPLEGLAAPVVRGGGGIPGGNLAVRRFSVRVEGGS
jgi:hypothetical protein